MQKNRREAIFQGAISLYEAGKLSTPREIQSSRGVILVPFAKGGTADFFAAAIAPFISNRMGFQYSVNSMPGRSGIEANIAISASGVDGLMLGLSTVSSIVTGPLLYANHTHRPLFDLSYISKIAVCPGALAINSRLPIKTLADLVRLAKESRAPISYASPGFGSLGYVKIALLQRMARLNLIHVGYHGPEPALVDAAAGQVSLVFDDIPSLFPYIKDGLLRPLALAHHERISILPNTPTFGELGFGILGRPSIYGIVGAPGINLEIRLTLQEAIEQAVVDKNFREKMDFFGIITTIARSVDFKKFMESEIDYYGSLLRNYNISPQARTPPK